MTLLEGPLAKLIIGGLFLAACVVVHTAGLLALSRWLVRRPAHPVRYASDLFTLVLVAWAIIGLHLMEIVLWALAYRGLGCLPDLASAFYFSSVTYTTVGYGDVVLHAEWRNLSGLEALTGIFLLGLSTAYFFGYLTQRFKPRA